MGWEIAEIPNAYVCYNNTKDTNGKKHMLKYISFLPFLEAVRLLLQTGCDIDYKDCDECTPLFHAVSADHPGIVQLLVHGMFTCIYCKYFNLCPYNK